MNLFRKTLNPFYVWKSIISSVKDRSELLRQLISVGIAGQFKRTILGNVWFLLDPLLTIVMWLLLARSGMFKPGLTGIPYPAYLLISFSLWIFFEGFFVQIGSSITESGRMLMEIYFPLEIKVLEKVCINSINFLITLSITLVTYLIIGIDIKYTALLFLPALIPLILLGTAVGMFFSLLEVVAMDIFHLARRSLRIVLYITPIVYAPHTGNDFIDKLNAYNPLTYLISVPRDLMLGTSSVSMSGYWISAIFSLILFLVVVQFYYHSKWKIIEKLLD